MADNGGGKNRGSNSGKLVRLGGNGGKYYDYFGHEIVPDEPAPEEHAQEEPVYEEPAYEEPAAGQRELPEEPETETVREEESEKSVSEEKPEPRKKERRSHADRLSRMNSDDKVSQTIKDDRQAAHVTHLANKKRQAKENASRVFQVVFFALVVILLVFVMLFRNDSTVKINTQYITTGTINNSVTGTIRFMRNEIQVLSEDSGTFMPEVNEGDRVSKGAVIGYVVKNGAEEKLSRLKSVDERIAAATEAAVFIDGETSSEQMIVDSAIDSLVAELTAKSMNGTLGEIKELSESLTDLFERKNSLLINGESSDSYLSELRKERDSIIKSLGSSVKKVTAPVSGIVSFMTDGKEVMASSCYEAMKSRASSTLFTSRSSSTLAEGEAEKLILPESSLTSYIGENVGAGNVLARITPDISFYITVGLEEDDIQKVPIGKKVRITAPGEGIEFEATVLGILYGEDGALAVMHSTKSLVSTISQRDVEGTVIFSSTEGFKVPLRVLSEWDEAGVTARITIVRSGFVEYVYVNVITSDGEYAIINSKSALDDEGISVRENDSYVVNFEDVTEGQMV